ncbi:MAG: hypothetical protein ACK5CE_24080 [Actinomycetes bacterium]
MSTVPRLPSAVEGQPAHFGTLLAPHPGHAVAFGSTYAHFWTQGVLDHPTKETTRIRNARITDCGY